MLLQAEANLTALIESTQDLIWSVDLDDRLMTFNSAFQRHFESTFGVRPAAGMLPEELVQRERKSLFPPLYARARAEGSIRVEFSLADGRALDLALNPILVDGDVTGISVFGKDITEQKAAERAICDAEKKYREIFDGALEGIFQTSLEGRILAANPAMAKMLGYASPEELMSTVKDIAQDLWTSPDERAKYLRQIAERGAVLKYECQFQRKDGRQIWLSLNTRRVCGADERLFHLEGFMEDITERKRAEQSLAASEARFRKFFEENGSVMFLIEPATGEIVAANRAACEFYGYPKDRLVGMFTRQISLGSPEILQSDQRRAMGRECSCFYYSHRLAGGEMRDVELHSTPFEVDGRQLLCAIVNDVTERKRTEQALIESEKLFRAITETSPLAMILTSGADERSDYMNPTFIRLFGYMPEEIPTLEEWWPRAYPDAEYRQWVMELWRNAVARVNEPGGAIDPVETVVTCKDRSNKTIEWGLVSLGGRNLAYGVDITERKRAEMELRNSEERFRATFEQAAVGILHTSFDGRILMCNDRFAEIVGYRPEEVPGMSFKQITLPEDLAASVANLQRLSNGKPGTASWEKRYIRKDGSLTWVKMTVSVQRDGEGNPLHHLAFVEDINAGKAAEERLEAAQLAMQTSEERYRTVFQSSPYAILISRVGDGTILDVNQAFLDSAGFERNEVLDRTSLDLGIWVNPDDLQKLTDALRLNGRCQDFEVLSRRRNGEIFWMRLSAYSIEIGGCPCRITFARDISDVKAAEERLAAVADALRRSEERYRTAFQTNLDAININRLSDGEFIDCNQAFVDITGYKREEVIGKNSLDLDIWADPEDRVKMFERLRQNSSCRSLQAQFRRKNKELLFGEMSASAIEIDGVPCILSITRDISKSKAAEDRLTAATKALQSSEERYSTVFHTSLDCITVSHLSDGRYIDVNKAFLDLIGIEPHEIVGKTSTEVGIWAHPETRDEIVEMLRENQSFRDYKTQFVKKNGELVWVLISASVIEIGSDSCIVSVVRDISDAKAAESTIQSLAFYDPLTGLPNRRLLFDRLQQTLSSGARIGPLKALLLVDLDNLRALNDALGHHIGDLLLQEVARRIAACVHDGDTVSRLGGDEFVVILEGMSEDPEEAAAQVRSSGEEILASIGQPCLLEDRECLPSASMGVTVFGDRLENPDEILHQADIALHLAKADGRNTMRFFSPALQAVVNAHATLENDLRLAIKTKQFELYYQPQVERGRMTGAEALIRWKHPIRGLVPPNDFIPLAEESRLILPVGDWVLETACAQIALWAGRKETAHLTVSVNISALQFRQPEFVDHVLAALDRTGANPGNLKLELTESMLVDNFEEVIAKMTELKSHGLSFSLDDFGTGYSSLAYLKRLPLDQLKIDRAFVRDMLVDLASGAIAQTIISLGRAMDMSVVAEGVETEEQRGFLAGLGCHAFQGYLFSRPLPVKEFEALL